MLDTARPARDALRTLNVTSLADYVRFDGCQRRFRFRMPPRDGEKDETPPSFEAKLSTPIDPILQKAGKDAENRWKAMLVDKAGFVPFDIAEERPFEELRPLLAGLSSGTNSFACEIKIEGAIGAFSINGRMDFVMAIWRDGRPRLRIVETKASRKDKTYQRIQIATYRILIDRMAAAGRILVGGFRISPADVDYAVGRLDEKTNTPQDLIALTPLELDMEIDDILQKTRPGGELISIAETPNPLSLPYCLDEKCDNCEFDVRCMTRSAETRGMELVGLPPATIAIFKDKGVANIDDLSRIDTNSPTARALRSAEGMRVDLRQTIDKAKARRATLPHGGGDPDNFQVLPLKHTPIGQLPVHFERDGTALVRIYVEVSYDYVENRIAALAAHVTNSPHVLHTPFEPDPKDPAKRRAKPGIEEVDARKAQQYAPLPAHKRDIIDMDLGGVPAANSEKVLQGVASPTVVCLKEEKWLGDYGRDTEAEGLLIKDFFRQTILAISNVAQSDRAKIHFYFYTRNEVTRLIEACTRCGGEYLSALADLLGCRQNAEQMIFSVIQKEIVSRFATGWTSSSLGVAASLKWYGQSYHWSRPDAPEPLDTMFSRDIFDFKTSLAYDASKDDPWLEEPEGGFPPGVRRERFEIRSRNSDTLKAPYLHALWGTLPTIGEIEARMRPITETDPAKRRTKERGRQAELAKAKADLEAYLAAGSPGHPEIIKAYLAARVHAVRWLEERIQHKNVSIDKFELDLRKLWQFDLPENNTFQSALTFLRIDQTVKKDDWLAEHLVPPSVRVQSGDTLPIKAIKVVRNGLISAEMDLDFYDIPPSTFAKRTSIGEGAFVRLSERQLLDPLAPKDKQESHQTQRMLEKSGSTCRVSGVDWDAGTIELAPIPNYAPNLYQPISHSWSLPNDKPTKSGKERVDRTPTFTLGTLDSSIADFVAGHVEARLLSGKGGHMGAWFDSSEPAIPPLDAKASPFALAAIERWKLPGTGHCLSKDQAQAVREGLESRVQLIKGPPGTGKTATTSAAILIRAATMHVFGDVVLVAANTHRAVDTLLERLADYRNDFYRFAAENGGPKDMRLNIGRLHGRGDEREVPRGAERIVIEKPAKKVAAMRDSGITLIAGTTAGMLKFVKAIEKDTGEDFAANSLIVDEASMLVFPHFLALASLVREDGTILLAGDDLQLSPIISNDWDKEDRPPSKIYQPFLSSYESMVALARSGKMPTSAMRESALRMTFRLPSDVRRLIEDIYRRHDRITLESREDPAPTTTSLTQLSQLLRCDLSVAVVIHGEKGSRNYNRFEAEILRRMIGTGAGLPEKSVAVITPHRAQRAYLTDQFGTEPSIQGAIDTVERFQGGEQDTVVVMGTESDPYAIGVAADFILNLNRANVAFSRAKKKLVVVVAETLLDHVPSDLDSYHSAVLWKTLRGMCRRELMRGELACAAGTHAYRVLTLGS